MFTVSCVLWTVACAGFGTARRKDAPDPVRVFLPGEPLDCLFEVIGEVTVQGPFRPSGDIDGGVRERLLEGVRLAVSRETAESGAQAVMVREIVYDENFRATEDDGPEITAVEGILLSFVDPACLRS
jgi:hypothetical protein